MRDFTAPNAIEKELIDVILFWHLGTMWRTVGHTLLNCQCSGRHCAETLYRALRVTERRHGDRA